MGKRIALITGIVLAVAAAGAGGFFYGKHVGQAQFTQARQRFQQGGGIPEGGFMLRGGTPQPGQQANASRNAVFGSVESVEGDTLVVKTEQDSVTVKVTESTLIEKTMSVGVQEMKVGDEIVVSGTRNDDGSITARSVQSMRGGMVPGGN